MNSPDELLARYVDDLRTVDAVVDAIGKTENIVADHLQMPMSLSWANLVTELATYKESKLIVRHDSTNAVFGQDGVWHQHRFKMSWKAIDKSFTEVWTAVCNAVLPGGERLIFKTLADHTVPIINSKPMSFRTIQIQVADGLIKEIGQVEFGIDDRDP